MHSSRMRTARCSGRLLGCVSAQGLCVCRGAVSAQGCVCQTPPGQNDRRL